MSPGRASGALDSEAESSSHRRRDLGPATQPRTLLDEIMVSRDLPNAQMLQFSLPSRQPWDVPEMCRLVANMFSLRITSRGRRGEQHITIFGPTGNQVQYVADYFRNIASAELNDRKLAIGIGSGQLRLGLIREITLISCGTRFTLPRWGERQRHSMGEVRRRLTETMPGHVDYALDCRTFGDPDYSREQRDHVGHHPMIQMGIASNILFVILLRRVHNILATLKGQRHVTLAFVCRSGRHRSVAIVEILSTCLRHCGLWTNVVHHSQNLRYGWRHLCGGYEICEQCSWSNEHQAIHDFSKVLFQGLLPVELYVQ